MKNTWPYSILLILSLVLIHWIVYGMNQDLHTKLKDSPEPQGMPLVTRLKSERLKLEESNKNQLDHYQWVDKRNGYAEIPLDRAYDYYLRSLKP